MKLKFRQYICGAVFFIGFCVLIGTDSENITLFAVKNLLALAAMAISAAIGDFIDKPVETGTKKTRRSKNVSQENNIKARDNDPERACV